MSYTIFYAREITKEIRRIPGSIVERIKNAINALRENPFPEGCKSMHGHEHLYRIRVGSYRIVYDVQSTIRIIRIVRVGHRKDVYRNL